MTSRLPLSHALTLAPFTSAEAHEFGVPASRLRARDLHAPLRGIRSTLPVLSHLDRCFAYAAALRPGHCFSHVSAAVVWGMWLPQRLQEDPRIHVLALDRARPPRMRGVVGHHAGTRSIDVALARGLPVSSALDTWWQLSTMLDLDELIAAGDSLVRRWLPLVDLSDLLGLADRHSGGRGSRLLRRAAPEVRADCDSPRETALRLILIRGGLPEPRVNAVVSKPGAAQTRYGDLVYERWRVIAEYDGHQHQRDARRYAADIARLEQLAAEGWIVIRVLAEHLADPASIVRRVEGALRTHGWPPLGPGSRGAVR